MIRYYVSQTVHALVYVSDSIFIGLKVVVPLFFIAWIINLFLKKIELKLFVSSLQWLMICAGILFLLAISSNTFLAWYSGNEDEKEMIISFATGPHWYQFFTPLFNYAILPIILWLRFMRRNIYALFVIVLLWYVTTYVVEAVNHARGFNAMEPDIGESINKMIVFLVAFIFIFLIVRYKAIRKGV